LVDSGNCIFNFIFTIYESNQPSLFFSRLCVDAVSGNSVFIQQKNCVHCSYTSILLLGHLQIYPVPISNGWDCTLAYTSYHKCIDDFNRTCEKVWFDERKNTATVFPMNASLKQTDLKSDSYKMENINGKSIDEVDYVLFSNVGNDFSDEQIIQLKSWIQFYQVKHGLVEVILYQNPEISFK
jgi:hypothetical protein